MNTGIATPSDLQKELAAVRTGSGDVDNPDAYDNAAKAIVEKWVRENIKNSSIEIQGWGTETGTKFKYTASDDNTTKGSIQGTLTLVDNSKQKKPTATIVFGDGASTGFDTTNHGLLIPTKTSSATVVSKIAEELNKTTGDTANIIPSNDTTEADVLKVAKSVINNDYLEVDWDTTLNTNNTLGFKKEAADYVNGGKITIDLRVGDSTSGSTSWTHVATVTYNYAALAQKSLDNAATAANQKLTALAGSNFSGVGTVNAANVLAAVNGALASGYKATYQKNTDGTDAARVTAAASSTTPGELVCTIIITADDGQTRTVNYSSVVYAQ
jgi:hypothetical protein